MEEVSHEPLLYTNQPQKAAKAFSYIFMLIFGLFALGAIVIGIYWLFLEGDLWIASCFSIPVGLLMGFIAWVAYDQNIREKEIKYEFVLNENGIDETRHYQKKNKVKENHIAFSDMDKILIGNYVNRIINTNGIDFFKFGVLVIVMYKDKYFFQRIFKANELTEWLIRMTDKNVPVYYTPYDLKQAFIDRVHYDVDFSKIDGIPWEEVEKLPPVEHEMPGNPFKEWQDENIELMKKNVKQKKTSKVDRYVTLAIFIYALFTGAVIMPQLPLEDGTFAMSDLLLLTVLLVNVLIPLVFVYWRSHTKWYMPFIYFIVASAGNCLALLFVILFTNIPLLFGSALFTNGMLLVFLWYPALIIMKLAKVVFLFIDKHNLL
ncbi:hypothetical protein CFK37_18255 [Virgibacillus phasianinus]|uniref:Uncharacterized protein n=1 Tax=Virgibacillus phasianinus TaxID=2017483 RepID=A0A220U7X1_9BACI|nr:hypothetical protein [Virgibacillus phasianinus]ASK63961.1 hypothetical protein CFK37_18255 [Virgibacillus phasianinus]